MVLLSVEIHLVFLGPTGVKVFLAELAGFGFLGLRGLARLDLLVYIMQVHNRFRISKYLGEAVDEIRRKVSRELVSSHS